MVALLQVFGSTLQGAKKTLRGLFFDPGFPRSISSNQTAAASGSVIPEGFNPVPEGGPVKRVVFRSDQPAAAGESMVIQVTYNTPGGAPQTMLDGGLFTFGAGTAAGEYECPLPAGGVVLPEKAQVAIVRAYVPGGAPTMSVNGILIEFYSGRQP